MKYLIGFAILLSSCARTPNVARSTAGIYTGVLPTKNDLVFYRTSVAKPGVTPAMADSRARAWFSSSGKALNVEEQKPITKKTDLVYIASLPARRTPADSAGSVQTLPALRFWVTVDNTGDSVHVFATNFEAMDKKGNYGFLEKQPHTTQQLWISMWLNDVDAAVTQMMESLTAFVTRTAY